MSTTLTRFLLGASAVAFGACILIKLAHAQATYVPPPTPLPPPVFNPSTPYTVPQPNYRPITPTTPSTLPNSRVTLPADEGLARPAVRADRRTVTPKARVVRQRSQPVVGVTPDAYSYYYAPFGYGYGCGWRRSWDGYWFRASPCS